MGEIIRITIDGKEKGSIDISNIKYDPKTKDIIITGKIIGDEDLIKQVLKGSQPALSVRAMAKIMSPEHTVNHMCIPKINVVSEYGQPILEKIKPLVEIFAPIEIPKCPITFDLAEEFLEAEITSEKLNSLFDEYKELIQSGILILRDEFKDLEDSFKNSDTDCMKENLYRILDIYMLKYGINIDEAIDMFMNNYKKYYEKKNNKGE